MGIQIWQKNVPKPTIALRLDMQVAVADGQGRPHAEGSFTRECCGTSPTTNRRDRNRLHFRVHELSDTLQGVQMVNASFVRLNLDVVSIFKHGNELHGCERVDNATGD